MAEDLQIWVYPNSAADDNECENSLQNAMDNVAQQLRDWGAIGNYYYILRYDHPEIYTDTVGEFWSQFDSWRKYNGYTEQGVHTCVSVDYSSGAAHAGDCSGCTAWTGDKTAVVGTYDPKETFKNTMIQESLHPFINSDTLDTGSSDNDLGEVTQLNEVTPMTTGHPNDHDDGTCNQDYTVVNATVQLTPCAKDGVMITADQET